jgi:hypothetical protein
VGQDTLQWAFDALDGEPDVPSLAFVHIPLPQFMCVMLLRGASHMLLARQAPSPH